MNSTDKPQVKSTNPGNFANNPQRASEAGRKGGYASQQKRKENKNGSTAV